MSVPQNRLMELMRQGQGPGAVPPPSPDASAGPGAGMSGQETAPMSAPMSTPEPKMGSREGAMINLGMALDLIEQALPALGSESDEGQKALAALRTLTGIMGPRKNKTNELQQSEILQMMQSLPQAGGATPEARAIQQAPVPGMPQLPQG